jgi:hypothetical protein
MDDIEARYRQIAEEFVIIAHRTASSALAIVYLRLAGHYAMLAQFHARQSHDTPTAAHIRAKQRSVSDCIT